MLKQFYSTNLLKNILKLKPATKYITSFQSHMKELCFRALSNLFLTLFYRKKLCTRRIVFHSVISSEENPTFWLKIKQWVSVFSAQRRKIGGVMKVLIRKIYAIGIEYRNDVTIVTIDINYYRYKFISYIYCKVWFCTRCGFVFAIGINIFHRSKNIARLCLLVCLYRYRYAWRTNILYILLVIYWPIWSFSLYSSIDLWKVWQKLDVFI